jgi:hypothetical protein
MVEKVVMPGPNVIDFARYQSGRAAGKVPAMFPRVCRHCDAVLLEGENEDECSSALNTATPRLRDVPRKFYAD